MNLKKQYSIDPYTKEEFTPKRSNQIFANRKNQVNFNNEKQKEMRRHKSPHSKTIDNNYKILIKILSKEKSIERSSDFLLGAGFDFKSYTSTFQEKGMIGFKIYDLWVIKIEQSKFKIYK